MFLEQRQMLVEETIIRILLSEVLDFGIQKLL